MVTEVTKQALTSVEINPLLAERWSPRAFSARMLTQQQIRALMEAARWSASAGNGQPWNFILIPRDDGTFPKFVQTLNPANIVWAQHAPLLLVGVAQTIRDDGKANPYAPYDLGQSMAHLSIQAMSMGLFVHQMAGFSKDDVRTLFTIPEGFEPFVVAAIGAIGDASSLPENLREREEAPRSRKTLESFVFVETWGQPYSTE